MLQLSDSVYSGMVHQDGLYPRQTVEELQKNCARTRASVIAMESSEMVTRSSGCRFSVLTSLDYNRLLIDSISTVMTGAFSVASVCCVSVRALPDDCLVCASDDADNGTGVLPTEVFGLVIDMLATDEFAGCKRALSPRSPTSVSV